MRSVGGARAGQMVTMADRVPVGNDVWSGHDRKRNAIALIEELSVDWDPSRYEDRYRMSKDELVAAVSPAVT